MHLASDDEPSEPNDARQPFADVRARRAVDELLRNTQYALVTFTGQADLKATIVIPPSSLMPPIVAARWSDHSVRPALAGVGLGAVLALATAITVVIPKFRLPRRGETRDTSSPAR